MACWRVQAGIDDEAARAEEFVAELAEVAFGVAFVPAVFGGQLLRVERPTLAVRGDQAEHAVASEARQAGHFILERELEMMAGHGLVINERPHFVDFKFRPG